VSGFCVFFLSKHERHRFARQFAQLDKLPVVLQPGVGLLSYVGFPILGVTLPQVYFKVAGCRTTGHQENQLFCSVNVNTGRGVCRWWFVHHSHWPELHSEIKRRDIDFLRHPWWPNEADLQAASIPFTTYDQHPGEIIFVSYGTVHWVRAEVSS
jgi:hypothetical protein